jgi:hypothetical protein
VLAGRRGRIAERAIHARNSPAPAVIGLHGSANTICSGSLDWSVTDCKGAEFAEKSASFHDPERAKLLETRKAITHGWLDVADALDAQGEALLAGEVRHFARHLPRVLMDKERVAAALIQHIANTRLTAPSEVARDRGDEFTRNAYAHNNVLEWTTHDAIGRRWRIALQQQTRLSVHTCKIQHLVV